MATLTRVFQRRDALANVKPDTLIGWHRRGFRWDSIFSKELDRAVTDMGVRILRTPVRAPKANSLCEHLMGTVRRACLGFLIPFGERHLRRSLQMWIDHYNRGSPHMSLGPGIPVPSQASPPQSEHRHRLPTGHVVGSRAVLGGLHHEDWLEKVAA
jgi:hypothetical protein